MADDITTQVQRQQWENMARGDTITVKVSKVSQSGNGLVFTDGTHINIGPVNKNSVGEKLTIGKINKDFAFIKQMGIRPKKYKKDHPLSSKLDEEGLKAFEREDDDIHDGKISQK